MYYDIGRREWKLGSQKEHYVNWLSFAMQHSKTDDAPMLGGEELAESIEEKYVRKEKETHQSILDQLEQIITEEERKQQKENVIEEKREKARKAIAEIRERGQTNKGSIAYNYAPYDVISTPAGLEFSGVERDKDINTNFCWSSEELMFIELFNEKVGWSSCGPYAYLVFDTSNIRIFKRTEKYIIIGDGKLKDITYSVDTFEEVKKIVCELI